MSTCPSNDIHSVYLDGELPPEFKAKYEEHLASCKKCQKIMESLKRSHDFLQNDANDVPPLPMSESFERLQSRMRYARIAKTVYIFPKCNLKYAAGIAAIALFAFVFPARLTRTPQTISSFSPLARNLYPPLEKTTAVLNGTIDENVILDNTQNASQNSLYRTSAVQDFFYDLARPVDVELPDVDVFRPNFTNQNQFHIRHNFDPVGVQYFRRRKIRAHVQFSE